MWDVVIVGAGPAGAATALGALRARPELRVLLLDRADFPRDKACGDGVAPHVQDVLAVVGVHDLFADRVPVQRLELSRDDVSVDRRMQRPAWVVPRTVLDDRLVAAAVAAGARLQRHRARTVRVRAHDVVLDEQISARVVVAADGASSRLRQAIGLPPPSRRALALRGYAPVPPSRAGRQVIRFGRARQPSYAWSFDRGDGRANIGYGELLRTGREAPSRTLMLEMLEDLLPGAGAGGTDWRGHHLPLSSWRWQQPNGRVLLVGDAASLVNPLTGEGIYYAVATGVLAGRAAAAATAVSSDGGAGAGARHRRAVRGLLGSHLRTTALAARAADVAGVVPAAVRAARADQQVFDDLVEIGLGRGLLTRGLLTGLLGGTARRAPGSRGGREE